jgi:hypothetical protein
MAPRTEHELTHPPLAHSNQATVSVVNGKTTQFAEKGSQRWLQIAVNREPKLLETSIRQAMDMSSNEQIEWISPREDRNFGEYRGSAWLRHLGVKEPTRSLTDFWPERGPMWDGLAKTSRNRLILIEAKAHIGEMISPPTRATKEARQLIDKSLRGLQSSLGRKSTLDWGGIFYQYTNRLAHLHYLRADNGLKAHLFYVYFVNASDVKGPTSVLEWKGAIKLMECYLGLQRHKLSRWVHEMFIDVNQLRSQVS